MTISTTQIARTFTGRFVLKARSGGWEILDPRGTYAPRWCATKRDAYRVIDSRYAHERLVAAREARANDAGANVPVCESPTPDNERASAR